MLVNGVPPKVGKSRERAFKSTCIYLILLKSWRWDSNPRPADYKSAALPTELRQRQDGNRII